MPPPLSDAQMEIMSIVWDVRQCTVADVLRSLQRRRTVTRNTVHTMMMRLVDKGWLIADGASGPFVFTAAVEREIVQQRYVEQMVKTVFDGSTEGMLLSLLQNKKLSQAEATRIRRMIRRAEDRS